jgi:hypothetical protein
MLAMTGAMAGAGAGLFGAATFLCTFSGRATFGCSISGLTGGGSREGPTRGILSINLTNDKFVPQLGQMVAFAGKAKSQSPHLMVVESSVGIVANFPVRMTRKESTEQ